MQAQPRAERLGVERRRGVYPLPGLVPWRPRLAPLGGLLATFAALASFAPSAPAAQPDPENPVWLQGTLGADVARVRAIWQHSGHVHVVEPRFLQRGDQVPIVLPTLAADSGDCVTVLALAERNLSFVLSFDRSASSHSSASPDGPESRPPPVSDAAAGGALAGAFPIPSAAGLAEVTRCGARGRWLQRLQLSLRSPRGTVQLLVVRGPAPPPSAAELLVSRTPGPLAPLQSIGSRPALGPLPDRVAVRRRAQLSRGAHSVSLLELEADARGDAQRLVTLRPGCHRLDVLTDEVSGSSPDVDARIVDPASGVTLHQDDATASDAKLIHCVAEVAVVRLEVQGAQSAVPVAGILASWRLPKGLPATWGTIARGSIARTLFNEEIGLLAISPQPEMATLGVAGNGQLFLPTEPGACYRLAAAAFRGQLTRLALGVREGPVVRQAQSGDAPGAELTFCAERQGSAQVEVQAVGEDLVWLFAAWRLPTGATPREETP